MDDGGRARRGTAVAPIAAAAAVLLCAGCGAAGSAAGSAQGQTPDRSPEDGVIRVVAAEDVWGSIAAQLGGARVSVRSVVDRPGVDPHSYEPTASDARALAGARLVIVNGIGYDGWASRLLAANPVRGRIVLDVGALLGLVPGDNPHQWYSPASVHAAAAAIAAAYERLDPRRAAFFRARERRFETVSLAAYDRLRAEIRRRFAGVAVGYAESVFAPLGRSLGLDLVTPQGFATAVAEGAEPSLRDEETVDEQARRRLIAAWVYDSQNATPDVQRVNAICRRSGVPVVAVTETLAPASASFEGWQTAELRRLLAALAAGARR